MNLKIVAIVNNMATHELIRMFDGLLPSNLARAELSYVVIELSQLIGFNRMPISIRDWQDYDKTLLICNSDTARYFLNADIVITNAELWMLNFPKKITSTDRPDKHKIFTNVPRLIVEIKKLMEI